MVMGKNDDKIILLKKQIEEKKSELNKVGRFAPITNCSIELDGIRYNINTLIKEQLTTLLVKLNMYRMSSHDLNISCNFKISGYSVSEWMTDIQSKIEVLNYKDEDNKLKQLEVKLTRMLSDEKKTELELTEIENLLK